jgi:hypothetical protein
MKLWGYVLMIACVGFVIAAEPAAWAQQSAAISAARLTKYNKGTEVVTSGIVQSIQTGIDSSSPKGTYMVLQASPLTLNVQLAALSQARVPFKTGDQVQVTGSLIAVNGKQILLAREIQFNGQVLLLRSQHGLVIRPYLNDQTQGGQQ